MKEGNLKKIFKLMFKKLLSISVDNNFADEINKRRRTVFDKNKPNSFFYEKLVGSIHVGGFRVSVLRSRWDDIKKAFSNYDIDKVSQYTDGELKKMMNNPKLIRNEKKLRACIKNAKIMKGISKECGSFGEYLDQKKNELEKLKEELIERFRYLGNVLVLDYLRDVGIDAIKPDVHVVRVMHRLGLIGSGDMSPGNIGRVIGAASQMSRESGEKLSVIDAVFWMYGGGGDNHVKKAICPKNKPLCSECPLTAYCVFYQGK